MSCRVHSRKALVLGPHSPTTIWGLFLHFMLNLHWKKIDLMKGLAFRLFPLVLGDHAPFLLEVCSDPIRKVFLFQWTEETGEVSSRIASGSGNSSGR